DWAIPSGIQAKMWGIKAGPWMKPHLEAKGIMDPSDQRNIIKDLLLRFDTMVSEIAQADNVVHVKVQGTLSDSEWNDEIHPSRDGFERVAGLFRDQLAVQFPGTF
ncbi:MAG: hypothetical protein AAF560_14035, partial [Acidobacteriota bacterium]